MSDIIYGGNLPPTPNGLSALQMRVLRQELSEDVLQSLIGFVGTSPLAKVKDLKRDYGAKGDGVTDDTTAIQNFITDMSVSLGGAWYVPSGVYLHSATITAVFGIVQAMKWFGDQGLVRGLGAGAEFRYTGSDGGKGWKLRALNNCIIENITFNGNAKADIGMHSCEYVEAAGANLKPSQNVFWTQCQFVGVRPNSSADAFQVGLDDAAQAGLQTSEYVWTDCYFASSGSGAARSGIHIMTTSNCKNFKTSDCVFNQVDYGFYQPAGSGTFTSNACFYTNIGFNVDGSAIVSGADSVDISGFRMENSGTGYRATTWNTGLTTSLFVSSGYVTGKTPADDYIAIMAGPSTIMNFRFAANTRAGANNFKLQINNPAPAGPGSIIVFGNKFECNTTALTNVPLYDGGNNHLLDEGYGRTIRADLLAIGNKTGVTPATIGIALPNVIGKPLNSNYGGIITDGNSAGITYVLENDKYIVTIPYTAASIAGLTKTLDIGQIGQYGNIQNVIMVPTTVYAGITGPVVAEVGISTDTDAFIVSATISAGATAKGMANADLGASLITATRPHPDGYFNTSGSAVTMQCKITSSSGNLSGLSSGVLTLVFTYKYQGP